QVSNPPNPYDTFSSEFVGEAPETKLQVFEETVTKSMITKSFARNEVGYRLIVNCYRGCIHGCTYCFARRYHEFIGYGAGTDFETKIVAKINAPDILRQDLKKIRLKIPYLEFSFTTDPYIPLEANYKLTQKCLQVCREFGVRAGIITKSPLVTRDIEIIKELDATVLFSIPFLTKESSNPFEPYTPVPEARFRAMKTLADRGITVGIGIAPVILGYNDSEIPKLLEKARNNGATKAFMSFVHFDTGSIEQYFTQRLEEKLPTKAGKILNHIKRERNGALRHKTFAERNAGKTERWEIARNMFDLHFKRLGYVKYEPFENRDPDPIPAQRKLF
ncbi:MAG: radical SAM protein, partial [Acidobacteria bacterium]|nr:radical SAM protein [Acidobacteriota bacterium]